MLIQIIIERSISNVPQSVLLGREAESHLEQLFQKHAPDSDDSDEDENTQVV
jgi:hypothetical protein